MDEKIIIERCKNGYSEYFEILIEKYEGMLYKYCFYLTGSQEEGKDLFQETWLKAYSKIKLYSDKYLFKNWLLSIASNTYKDWYRKQKRWSSKIKNYFAEDKMNKELASIPSKDPLPEEEFLFKDISKELKKSVLELKPHYKVVILLFYFEEKTIKEISYILSVPEGTVKSRLNQAKKILKEKLEVK
ncbi:RNA polymerase sigma factor [Vallitalea guaymasensis]|uniref:Sigma-70 family RNA polymerase sigma factor n=1 Tax=Vallitalea guaymasensis TaxID=1185412 RepID=A0A8J8MD69_9FIRM|nr:sigma-70 family RNA polymerase sigma factor [Vallitalea guaymasensis]QUH30797.1 sigma-70 family RNA polymerase sigma factor [Vallitalea guaymasensis]